MVADSADLSASGEALLQLEQQVQARYASIIGALGPETKQASLAPTSAWAATPGAPESAECQRWASAGAMCFSGIGRSLYPEQARQNALQVAVDRASQYVARQAGGRRPPESFREYVERFGRAEEVYPSRELRTGREFAYVAIVTLNPRFADPKALAASNTEPRTISAGDPVLIRGWRQPAGASTPAAPGEAWLRIDGQELRSDQGAEGAELVGLRQAGGTRGPLQNGDVVSLRGVWGIPTSGVRRAASRVPRARRGDALPAREARREPGGACPRGRRLRAHRRAERQGPPSRARASHDRAGRRQPGRAVRIRAGAPNRRRREVNEDAMGDLSNELHAIAARLQMRIGEALESDARRKVGASKTKGEDGPLWRLLRSDSEMPDMELLDVLSAFPELDLADLLDGRSLLERLPDVFGRPRDVIGRLLDARSPAAILSVGTTSGRTSCDRLWPASPGSSAATSASSSRS